jgi:hypothetical protein
MGLGILLYNLEGEELDVILDVLIAPVPANETLRVEDSVLRVSRQLILGRVTDQPSKHKKNEKLKLNFAPFNLLLQPKLNIRAQKSLR